MTTVKGLNTMKKLFLVLYTFLALTGISEAQQSWITPQNMASLPINSSGVTAGGWVKADTSNPTAMVSGLTTDPASAFLGISNTTTTTSPGYIFTYGPATGVLFDGSATAGHYCTVSPTSANKMTDQGITTPNDASVCKVLISLSGVGTTTVWLYGNIPPGLGGSASTFTALTDAATVTYATTPGYGGSASLLFTAHSGSRTLNLTGLTNGKYYTVKLIQDGTGGEGLTLGSGCTWQVLTGAAPATTVTLTSTASGVNVLAFTYDGTNCVANFK
jgi:hypothetical protein